MLRGLQISKSVSARVVTPVRFSLEILTGIALNNDLGVAAVYRPVIWSVAATEYDALLGAGVSVDVKIEYSEITSVPFVKSQSL